MSRNAPDRFLSRAASTMPWKVHLKTVLLTSVSTDIVSTERILQARSVCSTMRTTFLIESVDTTKSRDDKECL